MSNESVPKEKKFICERQEYQGKPVIAIFEVDESGKKMYATSTIRFGISKARAVLGAIPEIQKFLDEEG